MELRGERLLLREFAVRDVDAHAKALVEMFIGWANEHPRRNFQLAIVDADSTRLLGSFRSYGLDSACATESITAAQAALSARAVSPGVRAWADRCRAWVEQHRDGLATAMQEGRP